MTSDEERSKRKMRMKLNAKAKQQIVRALRKRERDATYYKKKRVREIEESFDVEVEE